MKKQTTFIVAIIALLNLAFLESVQAQKLVTTVTINSEKLTQETKVKLTGFQDLITQYINNYDWTDNSGRYEIPLKFEIYFEQAMATSFEDRYEAQLVMSNQAGDFQASDRRWRFPYQQGMQLNHSDQFHPLGSVLDLYIFALLGQEYDKTKKLGGESYYQKANQIAQLAKFSEFFEFGWLERMVYVQKLQAEAQIPYRELEYFLNQARSRLRLDDRKTADQYLRVILIRAQNLDREDPNTIRFYEMHHLELARLLTSLGLKQQLQQLTNLDPGHTSTYVEFLKQMGG